MVRSVLYLKPLGGDAAAIGRFFAEEGVLERAATKPGFLGAELHLPDEPSEPALVTASWSSREAYRGWVEDPWRAASSARAAAVFEAVEQPSGGGSLYEVVHSVAGTAGAGDGERTGDGGGTGDEVRAGERAGAGDEVRAGERAGAGGEVTS